MADIAAISPSSGTLIESIYDDPNYRDTYLIPAVDTAVDEFATGFFLSQPRWLARVSMNLGDESSRRAAIGRGDYAVGSSIGSWQIHGRASDEIVFGEHMGFMEYRFSLFERPDGAIEATTSVKYLNRFAPLYFGVVKPFHRGFTKIALGNAVEWVATQSVER